MKAHPALFEGEGRARGRGGGGRRGGEEGGEGQKIEEHFSQLTQEYWANTFPSSVYCENPPSFI